MTAWNWKDESRLGWHHEDGKPATPYQYVCLGIACLQRIADAVETLVARSDPQRIEDAAKAKAWEARWATFQPYWDAVKCAREAALRRLRGGRKVTVALEYAIERALSGDHPTPPYRYCEGGPIDPAVASSWRDAAVAYWNGLSALPDRIARDGTKNQARYREWLASAPHGEQT